MEAERITHPFAPVWNQNSKILILGSLPSVKSRENNFYYGHPRNRFWKVLAGIFEYNFPKSIDYRRADFFGLP
ncbi:uracil-DNA glycosylase family protein, partial [Ileibacterium valens]|uniref:uracil-DNA glycosylase family protein n=1 Tax=Ileibacterium valens TaxID=1862668 RepID=UPI003D9C74B5